MSAKIRKVLSLALATSLLFQQLGFAQIATELNITAHLSRMTSSMSVEKFRPLHLRYFSYNPLNDNFKVLVDKGDFTRGLSPQGTVPEEKLRSETQTLLNYFLVGVSLPDSMFWVNLRPDSEDQIIDQYLEKTDVGRIMLEADLQLKKDTSLMTSPKTPEGREYWDRLYKKAEELYGYDNVTIPTLTRPWIVPGEIIVRESSDSAYIYKATLKVMLESDYLKTVIASPAGSSSVIARSEATKQSLYEFKDSRSKALNEYSTELIKELIIPKLTKEVNSSKRYAPLRQVYYSLILSRWFKQKFRQSSSLRGAAGDEAISAKTSSYINLIDTKDLTNLISKEPWSKTTYFDQYKKSFTAGEYNLQEPVYTPTGQVIRSYFSGGLALDKGIIPGNSNPQSGQFGAGSPIRADIPNTASFEGNQDGIGRVVLMANSAAASPITIQQAKAAKEMVMSNKKIIKALRLSADRLLYSIVYWTLYEYNPTEWKKYSWANVAKDGQDYLSKLNKDPDTRVKFIYHIEEFLKLDKAREVIGSKLYQVATAPSGFQLEDFARSDEYILPVAERQKVSESLGILTELMLFYMQNRGGRPRAYELIAGGGDYRTANLIAKMNKFLRDFPASLSFISEDTTFSRRNIEIYFDLLINKLVSRSDIKAANSPEQTKESAASPVTIQQAEAVKIMLSENKDTVTEGTWFSTVESVLYSVAWEIIKKEQTGGQSQPSWEDIKSDLQKYFKGMDGPAREKLLEKVEEFLPSDENKGIVRSQIERNHPNVQFGRSLPVLTEALFLYMQHNGFYFMDRLIRGMGLPRYIPPAFAFLERPRYETDNSFSWNIEEYIDLVVSVDAKELFDKTLSLAEAAQRKGYAFIGFENRAFTPAVFDSLKKAQEILTKNNTQAISLYAIKNLWQRQSDDSVNSHYIAEGLLQEAHKELVRKSLAAASPVQEQAAASPIVVKMNWGNDLLITSKFMREIEEAFQEKVFSELRGVDKDVTFGSRLLCRSDDGKQDAYFKYAYSAVYGKVSAAIFVHPGVVARPEILLTSAASPVTLAEIFDKAKYDTGIDEFRILTRIAKIYGRSITPEMKRWFASMSTATDNEVRRLALDALEALNDEDNRAIMRLDYWLTDEGLFKEVQNKRNVAALFDLLQRIKRDPKSFSAKTEITGGWLGSTATSVDSEVRALALEAADAFYKMEREGTGVSSPAVVKDHTNPKLPYIDIRDLGSPDQSNTWQPTKNVKFVIGNEEEGFDLQLMRFEEKMQDFLIFFTTRDVPVYSLYLGSQVTGGQEEAVKAIMRQAQEGEPITLEELARKTERALKLSMYKYPNQKLASEFTVMPINNGRVMILEAAASPVDSKVLRQQIEAAFDQLGRLIQEGKISTFGQQRDRIYSAIWPIRLVLSIPGMSFDEERTPIENLGQNLNLPEDQKPTIVKGIQAWARLINVDREAARAYLSRFADLFQSSSSPAQAQEGTAASPVEVKRMSLLQRETQTPDKLRQISEALTSIPEGKNPERVTGAKEGLPDYMRSIGLTGLSAGLKNWVLYLSYNELTDETLVNLWSPNDGSIFEIAYAGDVLGNLDLQRIKADLMQGIGKEMLTTAPETFAASPVVSQSTNSGVIPVEEVRRLIGLLSNEKDREATVKTLSGIKHGVAILKEGLLKHSDASVRKSLATILGKIGKAGNEEAVDALMEAVTTESFREGLSLFRKQEGSWGEVEGKLTQRIVPGSAIDDRPASVLLSIIYALEVANDKKAEPLLGEIAEGKYSWEFVPSYKAGGRVSREQVQRAAGLVRKEIMAASPVEKGGVDFTKFLMTIQPMGSFKGLNFQLPKLTPQQLAQVNIDQELQQLQNMASSGIRPSGQRVKELIAACVQKKEISARADNLLLCLIDICKLEEENAYESEPELREALVIVDAAA